MSRGNWVGGVAALCLVPVCAVAQPPDDAAQLRGIEARGRLLYDYDRAAWVATDAAMATKPVLPHRGGWVVEPAPGGKLAVTFYGADGDIPQVFYRVETRNGEVVSARSPAPGESVALTPAQLRLVEARNAALSAGLKPCGSAPFNIVVVPPASVDAPIDVYLLTPQVKANRFPFGGHYEVRVKVGGEVDTTRAFAKSCLEMDGPPARQTGAALMVTHMLDPTPTELHVFLSMSMGANLFVAVMEPRGVWRVDGDHIQKLQEP